METVGLVSERIRAMWEIIGWIGSGIVVISMLQQRIFRLRSSSPARAVPAVNYPRLSANSGKVSASESASGRM